jgi:ABC-type transport system involved in multi-copper enzyme maturation permease subunit
MAMKGLLWKEWTQNRWYFLLAFLALGLQPSWGALNYGINQQGNIAIAWAFGIKQILVAGSSAMETTAMVVAVFLAALMLTGERGNGLNYLVTTPVSRREIIISKFIGGSLALIIIMFLISLSFIVAIKWYPAGYKVSEVINWSVITTLALLCLFSLGLWVASFTQGIVIVTLITAVIMALPWIFISMATQVYGQYYLLSASLELKLRYLQTYFFIPNYISREGYFIASSHGGLITGGANAPFYPLEITVLVLISGFCLWGAIKMLERNPLESPGEILLWGSFRQIGMILIALLNAILWAAKIASTPGWYVVYFFALWLGIYFLLYAVSWAGGWLIGKAGLDFRNYRG